jgi:hypothetical protein
MYGEYLISIGDDAASVVQPATLPELGLRETEHLQNWILQHPSLLGPGVEIVTKEFDRWQTAAGDPVLDRLDILALAPDGRLVVAELKRDFAPHTVQMQAINYAAMVSRLSPLDVAELWAHWHGTDGRPLDPQSVLSELQTKWLLTQESIRSPRIVLVAAGFPASVTASTVWLTEQHVDITLIRFRPYRLTDGHVVVSFTQLFPVPSVEDFTIGRRSAPAHLQESEPGAPWDLPAFVRLAEQANDATRAMLDLCSADESGGVSVADIAQQADISIGQVRGQLAGLTMRLRNVRYGFVQTEWPVDVTWLPGGIASYSMCPEYVRLWRQARDSAE